MHRTVEQAQQRCGGGPASTGAARGSNRPGAEHGVLSREEMADRYPQHNLRPDDCAVHDPRAGVLRTDRAVSAAVAAARANGATVLENTPVDSIAETDHGVVVTAGDRTWTFDKVIVASGGWSRRLMPDHLKAVTETHRIVLTWFIAQEATQFAPENFPIFSRWYEDRSLYGAPAVDGVTVKASVDGPLAGRARATPDPDSVPRELTREEIAKVTEIGTGFFLGKGFKMATGYGHIAAHEALGKQTVDGLDFVHPDRFKTR
ncbi:FAD-dependent oxidoreductase [Streptomyces stelliscabiei]|nr:FAD-dependent oxidoreductase [Streptomyces stelliscabiei]